MYCTAVQKDFEFLDSVLQQRSSLNVQLLQYLLVSVIFTFRLDLSIETKVEGDVSMTSKVLEDGFAVIAGSFC